MIGALQARELSFEERVRVQEAIERTYYSHQIEATRPFRQAVTRLILEKKVRRYLRQSAALERLWKTRITAAMLQAEAERMARQTRMPERLRELYAATGNDSLMFQETVARAALVDRLARSFYAQDATLHEPARREAHALRHRLLSRSTGSLPSGARGTIVEIVQGSEIADRPPEVDDAPAAESPRRVVLPPERFKRLRESLPASEGDVGPVREDGGGFTIAVLLEERPEALVVAIETVPKRSWDEWWDGIEGSLDESSVRAVADAGRPLPAPSAGDGRPWDPALDLHSATGAGSTGPGSACAEDTWRDGGLGGVPEARSDATAVWTGSQMIVWGGTVFTDYVQFNTGGRYDPATDSWFPTATSGAPTPRSRHTAVWTGNAMIVWGGGVGQGPGPLNTGGVYDPAFDRWSPTSTVDAPPARYLHTAVWTGSRMVIGGGAPPEGLDSGGLYDPGTDTWTMTSRVGAPSARALHTAVWSGREMIVWGGQTAAIPPVYYNDGAAYDPDRNEWSQLATTDAPTARSRHTAIWTGTLMIVWGGLDNTGGRYDPRTDRWSPTSPINAPASRARHIAAWTGSAMVVWGGSTPPSGGSVATGGLYHPDTDEWDATSLLNAPVRRVGHTAVWSGDLLIVWGGLWGGNPVNSGGRYDPANDSWTPTSVAGVPDGREGHRAVWTGTSMIVWGGNTLNAQGVPFPSSSGGRYDPALDLWSPTSLTDAPSPRAAYTMVWGDGRAIVWGGNYGTFVVLNTGARYDPLTDTWSPTTLDTAPSGRRAHTAVWAGGMMIVWGGFELGNFVNTGALYDVVDDRWRPTNTSGAPSSRYFHTAVWTGREMIVWGGRGGGFTGYLNSGARYDPADDRWTLMPIGDAPLPREGHGAVWTGRLMLIWGGYNSTLASPYLDSGGRYDLTADSWSPMGAGGNPGSRFGHAAVWSGSHMVVWGGSAPSGPLNTGGRYDPADDRWTGPTSALGAPLRRRGHTAVWTPAQMLIWGGTDAYISLNTGGRYCDCSGPTTVYYQDADGDGLGDAAMTLPACTPPAGHASLAGDCSDADAGAWSPPSEARDLLLPDDATLAWSPPASPGSAAVRYDVVRSTLASDFVSAATCVVADGADLFAVDAEAPASGRIFFYLVRAENGCPDATDVLGTASDGTPIPGRLCP